MHQENTSPIWSKDRRDDPRDHLALLRVTPVQVTDFREQSRRAETPKQRPATFDGRRRTGEEHPIASGWELVYLTDAGVLDATCWGIRRVRISVPAR